MSSSVNTVPVAFTPTRKHTLITELKGYLAWLESLPVDRSCKWCGAYSSDEFFCAEFQQTVPIHYREIGCDKHWDDVPF